VAGFYSGRDGKLYLGGDASGTGQETIAKVQNWSFSMSQAVIETTSMGDTDRTLKDGIRSYSGSARVFYYSTDGGSNVKTILENSIKRSSAADAGNNDPSDGVQDPSTSVKLKLAFLDGAKPRFITFWVFITGLSMSASMGEVSSVDINWEANGAPVESSLATGNSADGS
tara:strand:- start:3498 stop:4007 length:510 start_codon:yes stop_codon:yes gene_type:complete